MLKHHITRLLGVLLLFASLCGCRKQPPPASAAAPHRDPAAAAVAIMRLVALRSESLSSPVQHADEVELRQYPVCSGFVLATASGPRIATAAHCLQEPKLGATAIYVDAARWRATASDSRIGEVSALNVEQDWALLIPEDGDAARLAAAALTPGRGSAEASQVTSVSLRANSPLSGTAAGGSAPGSRITTTLDVTVGWSGAPVLAADGSVIGMVIAFANRPHSGVYVTLPEGI